MKLVFAAMLILSPMNAIASDDVFEITVRVKPYYEFKRELTLMNRELQFSCSSKQKTNPARATLARMAMENSQKMIKRITDEIVTLEKEKQAAENTAKEKMKAKIKEAEDLMATELDQLEAIRKKDQDGKEFREQRKRVQRARVLLKVRKEMNTPENIRKMREAIEENAIRNMEALLVIGDRYEALSNQSRICESQISDSQVPAQASPNVPDATTEIPQPVSEDTGMTPVQTETKSTTSESRSSAPDVPKNAPGFSTMSPRPAQNP